MASSTTLINNTDPSSTLLLSQVPSPVLGGLLSLVGVDRIERDIELVDHLPVIRTLCPDLHRSVVGFIDNTCAKFGNGSGAHDGVGDGERDPATGMLASMKHRVEIIESLRVLRNAHRNSIGDPILSDIDPILSSDDMVQMVQIILLENLAGLSSDIDMLAVLPMVKRYMPSLHKAFVCMVDPIRGGGAAEPSMDSLRHMSTTELIDVMKKHGVPASARYSREILLRECAREFERDCTGLRKCTVESIHMVYVMSQRDTEVYISAAYAAAASNNKYLNAMKRCISLWK